MTTERFADRVAVFLEAYFALHPVRATAIGAHAHDGRWPDMTEAGRQARLAATDAWSAELVAFQDDALSPDERLDRDLLLAALDADRFGDTVLREESWDAMSWTYLLGDGLFLLVSREHAPLAARLAAFTGRLEGLPALVDAAISGLAGTDDRPVARIHAATAVDQLPGVSEIIADALAEAEAAAPTDRDVASILPRLRSAAATGQAEVERLADHIRDVVLPGATGDGVLGPELFSAKLRHTLSDPDLTPERVLAAAERDAVAVRSEMVRIARELWPTWRPGVPAPTAETDGSDARAEQRLVREVVDAIAAEHPAAPDLLDACQQYVVLPPRLDPSSVLPQLP